MLIRGARVAFDFERASTMDLWIEGDRVYFGPPPREKKPALDGAGLMVLPGLINAHDHLELNLFPRLGRGSYPNATVWAEDIYHPDRSPIREHLRVPKSARLRWGAIKNLLSGVTTVAHHNPLPSGRERSRLAIRVVTRYGWAHSIRFSPDWQAQCQATGPNHPFIIHAAEGTDEGARCEIALLDRGGALSPSTVLIHGVGIGERELEIVRRAGSSLVWCPSSNHFTLGRSLNHEVLSSQIRIALGTDSAITGTGDLLDELRFANAFVDAERLYAMVTTTAARILRLRAGFGEIRNGGPADLLIVHDEGLTPAQTLLRSTPKMVIVRGRIELACADVFACQANLKTETRGAFFLRHNVRTLLRQTEKVLQAQPKLAGKMIAA